MADDEGRLDRVEAKLDALIDALSAGRSPASSPVATKTEPEWDWDEFVDQHSIDTDEEVETVEPYMVPIEDVPDVEQPDIPTLPNFPRPFPVRASQPPAPVAVDPETGAQLDGPIGATPTAVPTGVGSGHRIDGSAVMRDFHHTYLRQLRDVPLEDRPK